jgi:hypothetical protein
MSIFDPRIFNVVIIAMCVAASARWAFEKNWAQAYYWICAAGLNIAVTFMAK